MADAATNFRNLENTNIKNPAGQIHFCLARVVLNYLNIFFISIGTEKRGRHESRFVDRLDLGSEAENPVAPDVNVAGA